MHLGYNKSEIEIKENYLDGEFVREKMAERTGLEPASAYAR